MEEQPTTVNESPKTMKQKINIVYSNITVEPLMLCYILPSVMGYLAIQNLNLEKACRVDLGYSEDVCVAMANKNASGYNDTQEVEVQKLVATMSAYRNFFQSILPCALLLFLGSWSDRHKRRLPCIFIPLVGEMVAMIGFLICTYFFYELPLWVNTVFEAFPGLTGSWTTMYLGVNAYVSDVSSLETRTLRIGVAFLISNICVPIGFALSGVLFTKIGFYGVFSLCLTLILMAMFYGIFFVDEPPRKEGEVVVVEKGFFRDFFELSHVKDTFVVCFKDPKRRMKVIAVMVLVMLIMGPFHGEVTVLYIFVRYKFGWKEIDYSMYLVFHFAAQIIGTAVALMWFSKYLKMSDAAIGIWATGSKIFSSIAYTLAPSTAYFYAGAAIEGMASSAHISTRAILSKLAPTDELGKIFSLFGVCEALMPLIYGPMYSMVYKATIHIYPSLFFVLGGVLTIPCIFIFGWLYADNRKDLAHAKEAKKQHEIDRLLQIQLAPLEL